MKPNTQKAIAGLILAVSIGLTAVFTTTQKRYNSDFDKANKTLLVEQNKLADADKKAQRALLDKTNPTGQTALSKTAKAMMVDTTIANKANRLANALFTYNNGKEFVNRQKKVTDILAPSALNNHQLFPDKVDKNQAEGQDMKSEVYSTKLMNGASKDKNIVNVYMEVHHGDYYQDNLVGNSVEGFELTYDRKSGKFTSINSVGKFPIKDDKGEE